MHTEIQDHDTSDGATACANCYNSSAYPEPGDQCAWCGEPRGTCGYCAARPSDLPLCATCGFLQSEAEHLLDGGGDAREGRAALLQRVLQHGLQVVLEQELGITA